MSEILRKYLTKSVGKRIIVITSDGGGYMGMLKEFDNDFIVMSDVYESTTATSLTWHKVNMESPVIVSNDIDDEGGTSLTPTMKLNDVIIHLSHVIRIWPR